MNEYVDFLGWKAKDRITGFAGVVTTVSFDLYGCVQCVLTPPVNEKGETPDGRWFDSNRLVLDRDAGRVMSLPAHFSGPTMRNDHGPADKPAFPQGPR